MALFKCNTNILFNVSREVESYSTNGSELVHGSTLNKTIRSDQEVDKLDSILNDLADYLGVVMFFLTFLSKLPQTIKIIQEKSGKGISKTSMILSAASNVMGLPYPVCKGFPFISWGQIIIFYIHNIIITTLIYYSNEEYLQIIIINVTLNISLILIWFLWIDVLHLLFWCRTVIVLLSIVFQVLKNHKNKNTGYLSGKMHVILIMQNILRLFVIWIKTLDFTTIFFSFSVLIGNSVISYQIIYYRIETRVFQEIDRKNKNNKLEAETKSNNQSTPEVQENQDIHKNK